MYNEIMDIVYEKVELKDISASFLEGFVRFQEVRQCWRKQEGRWVLKDIAFTENWDEDELKEVSLYLGRLIQGGGAVFAARNGGKVVGFSSVKGDRIGSRSQYMTLGDMEVSFEYRARGIGRQLFMLAANEAVLRGAGKLYISAHSSKESQAFYKAMGCVEAEEYDKKAVEAEPCDCQLEYQLY